MSQKKRQPKQKTAGQTFRRFEFVLRNDSQRDQQISGYLDQLPRGQAAEFIRAALWAAMSAQQPDQYPPEPLQLALPEPAQPMTKDTSASDAFERLFKELAALRSAVENQPGPVTAPPLPMLERVEASSGIDMSGPPRKRAPITGKASPAPQPASPPGISQQDAARELVRSIFSYGKSG